MPARTWPLRATAVAMATVEIVIHAVLTPAHLHEVPYVGALFAGSCVAMTVVAISLLSRSRQQLGWVLGAATCAGMFAAFLVSRVTGLPDYHEGWTSDSGLGLLSLPPELVFLACAAAVLDVSRFRASAAPA